VYGLSSDTSIQSGSSLSTMRYARLAGLVKKSGNLGGLVGRQLRRSWRDRQHAPKRVSRLILMALCEVAASLTTVYLRTNQPTSTPATPNVALGSAA
jgi:hypothetical protein